ncbi:hypothetical protein F5B19DRAFT_469932 [Rostrohypoxylon terebratum]|nr:hypothetical protein F5B19DRAFT_469932 [Rostrohypoxylon terebratum]
MGKPTVVCSSRPSSNRDRWSLIVPCQSGGLLHTSATDSTRYYNSVPRISTEWQSVDRLATDLGIISAVSVTEVQTPTNSFGDCKTELVAACISVGQLKIAQGPFHCGGSPSRWKWEGKTSAKILRPGEVTGNPVVITDYGSDKTRLDLLVPSAEGGIFHFISTQSTPDDWHMIGRVAFPQNIPPASCLSFHSQPKSWDKLRSFYALVQIHGRLYYVKTTSDVFPWYDARLDPIVRPGSFFK